MTATGIWIIGAGGYARCIADAIRSRSPNGVAGLVIRPGEQVTWYDGEVITEPEFMARSGGARVSIGVGDNAARETVASKLLAARSGLSFPVVVHRDATISPYASLDVGSVVLARTVVNPCARVGAHVSLYTGSIVEHDCVVEDYVTLAPAANLGGTVRIGARSFIGLGASILHGVGVGCDVVIGAGAVVTQPLEDCTIAVGMPARVVRTRTRNEPYL
jgi:acetyltransferase EpsM